MKFSYYNEIFELFFKKMKNKIKDIESERFINIIEAMINKNEFKSFYQVAHILDIPQQRFSDIKAGRQSVTRVLIDDICNKFPHINKIFITTGEGEMFINTHTPQTIEEPKAEYKREKLKYPEQAPEMLVEVNRMLKELLETKDVIKAKDETIAALRETIVLLKNTIEGMKNNNGGGD